MTTYSPPVSSRSTFLCLLALGAMAGGLDPTVAAVPAAAPAAVSAGQGTGSISGTLSNAVTRNLLEGAKVEIPQLGLSALTDDTGRFVLQGVPEGSYELVASYIGLDASKATIVVTKGEWARRDFDLSSSVYQMSSFTVSGEREGMAAAITAQRNADNVKNVVSMDYYGNLPNMNATELALRLPGVAGITGDEVMEGLSIRGAGAGFNTITVDGGLLSSFGASSGQTRMQTFTGSMFESLELIKGHTPDKEAASLGGTINLKSRSPLSMKEKRRIGYNFNVRIAPPLTWQMPLREQHRSHPLLDANYSEVFSVLGGERNFGVSFNFFYSENAFGNYQTSRDHQNTTTGPAYIWDYRTRDNYNNRKQASVNAKMEYRLSRATKFSLNMIYNDHTEPARRQYTTRAYAAQTVGTTGTAGILPGYTDDYQQVRASTGSNIDITSAILNRLLRTRQIDFGAEHNFQSFQIDYNAIYGQTQYHNGGDEANLLMRINNIGWTLDRRQSDLLPLFTQTTGADFKNAANYRPPAAGLTSNSGDRDDSYLTEFRGNVRYRLPTTMSLFLKTGLLHRETEIKQSFTNRRRWSYVGTAPLATADFERFTDNYNTGDRLPRWDAATFYADGHLVNPSLWTEDRYFTQQQKTGGRKWVDQKIDAAYIMANGKIGGTGFLTGVRIEKTAMQGKANVQSDPLLRSTAAQQAADPEGSAFRDWNNPRNIRGEYTKSFPSAHVYHDITPNLKARLSWSTSFGRPAPSVSFPTETVDNANDRVTVSNPGLQPQMAATWDGSLEYYFKPVGSFTVGHFRKRITDYFGPAIEVGTVGNGPDNGFNGQYEGYSIYKVANLGSADVNGWEFSYQQQLSMLPGLLKGFGVGANYTILKTNGDFGGVGLRSGGAVAGFIPRTWNFNLSWRYKAFSTRFVYNYTSTYLNSYGGTSPARNYYYDKRKVAIISFAYRVSSKVTMNLTVDNAFNEPQRFYRYVPAWMGSTTVTGTTITAGISGQF
jgi:iron complex outermembrane receptor protein